MGTPGSGQFAALVFAKIVVPNTFVPVLSMIDRVADPMEWLRACVPRGLNEWVITVPSVRTWI